MNAVCQTPSPGTHRALCRGDRIEFRLRRRHAGAGAAWLRTNLGAAVTARRETIDAVERCRTRLARDWRDWPMIPTGPDEFSVTVPVVEVGHFEAKTYFLERPDGVPEWPDGENVSLSVAPAHSVCANGVYNAFVRQFSALRPSRAILDGDYGNVVDARDAGVTAPSGTFRDVIERLDFIIGELGCRYLLLLPIHPIPAVYGRMGLYGSPYAATDFYAVEPTLARFDRTATPMDQFDELVDAVHARQAGLLLDIAINHCGWAATLHARHPEWVVREPDGAMRSPGAWGTTWHDLTELDYNRRDLWRYMADVLLFWCRRGVDGFRCDAGYMVPLPAWEYIIAKVREQYPDTLFMLEGLGGKISVTRRLLQNANFNWAYSELFQQYTREQVEDYVPRAHAISVSDGVLVNFAETHDNNRLAATSPAEARLRTVLAALFSHQGAFAFANGLEWLATEKIMVHGNSDLNWGATPNLTAEIAHLNRLLRRHPAFYPGVPLQWVHTGSGTAVVLRRGEPADAAGLLIAANLDTRHATSVAWRAEAAGIGPGRCLDLMSDRHHTLEAGEGHVHCRLPPGAVRCFAVDPTASARWLAPDKEPVGGAREPERVLRQRALAKLMELRRMLCGFPDDGGEDPNAMARDLLDNPADTVARLVGATEDILVRWEWPRDLRRCVVVPPGHILMMRAPAPFRIECRRLGRTLATEVSLPAADGVHFVLLTVTAPGHHAELSMRVFGQPRTKRATSEVLFLAPIEQVRLPGMIPAKRLPAEDGMVLRVNRMGGMLRAATQWGAISSRYDALLAANLNPDHPVDRRVMLTRYRAWIMYRGYSHALNGDCLTALDVRGTQSVQWRFSGPFVPPVEWIVELRLEMAADANAVRLSAGLRPGCAGAVPSLTGAVELILRPDIEDRCFHDDTLAYAGPERDWPAAVQTTANGFQFRPDSKRCLRIETDAGVFVSQPEWVYQVAHPIEAQRGMRADADLFSPGFFRIRMHTGQFQSVCALAGVEPDPPLSVNWQATDSVAVAVDRESAVPRGAAGLEAVLEQALRAFLVRRGSYQTVIAGYPWFLDWGRDTLIVVRGLIAAGMQDDAAAVLRQFAEFEDRGTLPNMIRGSDARDRDTSDAPLWFVTACADLARSADGHRYLEQPLDNGSSLLQVVRRIVDGYLAGTPNGIRVDPDSGLVFSPAHFTWMDTNYPAATPREGYPVEIQALWHAALRFLATMTVEPVWQAAADRVQQSLMDLFFIEDKGYFSDCLHASAGESARQARADDALRPNQLFLLTLDVIADARRIGRRVLAACGELVVPGALRSLADRAVEVELPVVFNGRCLNDPGRPYWGRYEGDEDTRRKPAYHNGTAWVWLYPSYAEAWWKTYGVGARDTVLSLLGVAAARLREGCLHQLPELLDGDAPHRQRGCDAQAWSVSEFYRVLRLIRQAQASE